MKKRSITVGLFPLLLLGAGCQKYLDKTPDSALAIPTSIQDCLAIMDNQSEINNSVNTAIGEGSSDNYYYTTADYNALTKLSFKSIYIWDKEIFYDAAAFENEWAKVYGITYKANIVLQAMQKVDRLAVGVSAYDNAVGMAYFLRAYAHQIIVRNFAPAYLKAIAPRTPGIPLVLTTDFNKKQERASLKDSYQQIITDLQQAIRLLPPSPAHVMRPSRAAAYGLLSRTYLSMNEYELAASYADSALLINSQLMDYNQDPFIGTGTFPIKMFNAETIFYTSGAYTGIIYNRAKVDSVLYQSYSDNDLRKKYFFRNNSDGSKAFVGNYTGATLLFLGIATDELFLTRAEARAQTGDVTGAREDLNLLLSKRYKTGTYNPITTFDKAILINTIQTERRKELLMRDLRFMDIKRINIAGGSISIKRVVNNTDYLLPPNDNRFALPLPASVIQLSGMAQNER